MLSQLSDRLEEEVRKYVQINRAILAKEQELKDIYEIQKSASTLTALIEAHQRKQDEFDKDVEAQREELSREIETVRKAWAEEKKQHEAEIKEREVAETRRREREREEYRYSFCASNSLPKISSPMRSPRRGGSLKRSKRPARKELTERQRLLAGREEELAGIAPKGRRVWHRASICRCQGGGGGR